MGSRFAIHVAKENLKFSAAHFIAYPGFREPLHGHNYQVGIRVRGDLSSSGYVLDFGLIKKLTKEIVDRLDERTLIPERSDCLGIDVMGEQVVTLGSLPIPPVVAELSVVTSSSKDPHWSTGIRRPSTGNV